MSEHNRPNAHTLVFSVEKGWDSWRLVCGFDRTDPERPCWPHTEDGERYSQENGERDGCVYEEWVSEVGTEGFRDVTLCFDLTEAHWGGDHFQFTVGRLIDDSEVGR
jgi:hypothetical protein